MNDNNTLPSQPRDIMHYESDIFAVADLLISAGVKQSDFPAHMMPFFALVMLESRMINAVKKVESEYGISPDKNEEMFRQAYQTLNSGYNEYIVMKGKTLSSICSNDSTFDQDFSAYLKAFDDELKKLLGIDRDKSELKFLDMDKIVAELRSKGILMQVATAWSVIDLSPYDNSAITTLEEHIKRKWADMSASTAGEQYTPDDIISLIADIVALKISKPKNEMVHIYDPTSGGANLLFGVEDRLSTLGYTQLATWGSEYNDALYALAAIESRFRKHSTMHYGNTLTTVPYKNSQFDVIVANPPYGTKWSGYQKEIKHDELGQFKGGLPSVSDGQLLFMQHILWQLSETGIAVEVHNGSTLFSGDAGSGESNIRKYIFDQDWVEAIIQMPQNEFFNTGIYTYLWIMNKNKKNSIERRNKVALIDGSGLWQLLKKAKGDKRREMSAEHRAKIVEALAEFKPSDICKIFDREHFYYNKQSLTLTETDINGNYIEEVCQIEDIKSIEISNENITALSDLSEEDGKAILNRLKSIDITEQMLFIKGSHDEQYYYNKERDSIVFEDSYGKSCDLGCGTFVFSLGTSKGKKNIKVSIDKRLTSDYEIIPHHFNKVQNDAEINAFMQKYVFKPYTLGTNTIGVEVNFNKEFYVPEKIDDVEDLTRQLNELNFELKSLGV